MMADVPGKGFGPIRLGLVEGYQGRKNEMIFYPPSDNLATIRIVIYFGGDMQDYKENMLAHRDNKHYSDWDLETTANILHQHYPDHLIFIIKPSKMALKTFSCFENFVDSNNFGAPSYSLNLDSLRHLKLLLKNVATVKDFALFCDVPDINSERLILIGFSKGCVVLNQLIYSIHYLKSSSDDEIETFLKSIISIYWIDGGHSGTSPTWITDKSVLESFSKLDLDVNIHVTPYQVQCDTRPRIGKEEKIFRETLIKMGVKVKRKLHFLSQPRSLDNHFKVLQCFFER